MQQDAVDKNLIKPYQAHSHILLVSARAARWTKAAVRCEATSFETEELSEVDLGWWEKTKPPFNF